MAEDAIEILIKQVEQRTEHRFERIGDGTVDLTELGGGPHMYATCAQCGWSTSCLLCATSDLHRDSIETIIESIGEKCEGIKA